MMEIEKSAGKNVYNEWDNFTLLKFYRSLSLGALVSFHDAKKKHPSLSQSGGARVSKSTPPIKSSSPFLFRIQSQTQVAISGEMFSFQRQAAACRRTYSNKFLISLKGGEESPK